MLKKTIKLLISQIGYSLVSKKEIESDERVKIGFEKLWENTFHGQNYGLEEPTRLSAIIFSRDRPMQLHALLESMKKNITHHFPDIFIIYSFSHHSFQESYKEVLNLWKNEITLATEDPPFKERLKHVLDKVNTKKLFFLVDDIIFKKPVDLALLSQFPNDIFIPSLRMGRHLSYCYTLAKTQPLPEFLTSLVSENHKDVFNVWQWSQGMFDWNYPLSVDGHIFNSAEIRIMEEAIHYRAPNSFEQELQRFFPLYARRYGICFKESVIVNIPVNKVQNENNNLHGSIHSSGDFLKKWQEGFQIDIEKIQNFINKSAHEEIDFSFMTRKK